MRRKNKHGYLETKHKIGNLGEEIAKKHLLSSGYKVLHTNWRYRHLEIDIIARKDDELIIVEVKTRTGINYGHPSDAITASKMKHLISAAEAYIQINDIELETRFDVITVVLQGEKHELEHFEDAFFPGI